MGIPMGRPMGIPMGIPMGMNPRGSPRSLAHFGADGYARAMRGPKDCYARDRGPAFQIHDPRSRSIRASALPSAHPSVRPSGLPLNMWRAPKPIKTQGKVQVEGLNHCAGMSLASKPLCAVSMNFLIAMRGAGPPICAKNRCPETIS